MYYNLLLVINKYNISFDDLAKKMNISVRLLEEKINGNKDFVLNEVSIILGIFSNYSFEFLFKK